MSRELLISDLQAKGEELIATLWRESRAAAERFQAEADQRRADENDRCELAGRQAAQEVLRSRTMAARRRAEVIITQAEQELSARLYNLALEQLDGAWSADRATLLARLAAELPPNDWGRIRVHPVDLEAAAKLFPQAETSTDPLIPGGLVAISRDGRVTIDNTWSTRLRRIWSRLVPRLLREVTSDAGPG